MLSCFVLLQVLPSMTPENNFDLHEKKEEGEEEELALGWGQAWA